MKKLLAHIVYYKLKPTNLCELIRHIEDVLHHESKKHTLRNNHLMLNTLKDLKLLDVHRPLSTQINNKVIALLDNFEHLIVDELMWRNIEKEAHQRRSLNHKPRSESKSKSKPKPRSNNSLE
jgi:hypothetical protein